MTAAIDLAFVESRDDSETTGSDDDSVNSFADRLGSHVVTPNKCPSVLLNEIHENDEEIPMIPKAVFTQSTSTTVFRESGELILFNHIILNFQIVISQGNGKWMDCLKMLTILRGKGMYMYTVHNNYHSSTFA